MDNLFVDKDVAKRAIDSLLPLMRSTMDNEVLKFKDLHIIVGNINGDVLAELSSGIPANWLYNFDIAAENRFIYTANNGEPIQVISENIYHGSWIDQDVVVSCCSEDPSLDEQICRALVAKIHTLLFETEDCLQ